MKKAIVVMSLFIVTFLCFIGCKEANAAENVSVAITKENFPDEKIRHIISWQCDKDNNRVLSKEEIQGAKEIWIRYEKLEDYDLKGLSKLSELKEVVIEEAFEVKNVNELQKLLHLQTLRIEAMDFCLVTTDKNTELEELTLDAPVKKLDLSKNKKLKSLVLRNCEVKKLSLNGLPKLQEVYLKGMFKSIVIKNCPKLKLISGEKNNKLQTMTLKQLPTLKDLEIENAKKLKKLFFSSLPKLKKLSMGSNSVKKLDFKKTPNLKILYVSRNKKMTKLDLRPLKKLCELEWSRGKLQKIQFGMKKYLTYLDVSDNKLRKLDIRNAKKLSKRSIYTNGNPKLKILR